MRGRGRLGNLEVPTRQSQCAEVGAVRQSSSPTRQSRMPESRCFDHFARRSAPTPTTWLAEAGVFQPLYDQRFQRAEQVPTLRRDPTSHRDPTATSNRQPPHVPPLAPPTKKQHTQTEIFCIISGAVQISPAIPSATIQNNKQSRCERRE